jgi:hypothetical protein
MMLFLIGAGVLSFIFGILFLFSPKTLRAISSWFNRALSFEEKFIALRIGVGTSLLLAAALMLFTAYFLFKKYG